MHTMQAIQINEQVVPLVHRRVHDMPITQNDCIDACLEPSALCCARRSGGSAGSPSPPSLAARALTLSRVSKGFHTVLCSCMFTLATRAQTLKSCEQGFWLLQRHVHACPPTCSCMCDASSSMRVVIADAWLCWPYVHSPALSDGSSSTRARSVAFAAAWSRAASSVYT